MWVAVLLTLASVMGCRPRAQGATTGGGGGGEATATEGGEAQPQPPPSDWPRVLVVGPGTGPALYLGTDDRAPAVGYLNPGVRVRLESAPQNGRVQVLVGGALSTKGWVPLSRVAAYVQQRGRVEGTRTYVGPNDMLALLERSGDQMRVEVRPWLGGSNYLGPFVGTFPANQLSATRAPDTAEAPTPGQCYRLPAGQTVPVYDRPGGQAVASLPALDPPATVTVLREANGWYGVRAGYGPYVTGYVQGALTQCEGEPPAPQPPVARGDGTMPYWMTQERGNLHRVAAGTRIRFHGRTIARLRQEGWARELGRQAGDLVDVFVAVTDDVALRGLVPASSLTLVEGAPPAAPTGPAAQPTAPAQPQEPLPDELE